MTINLDSRAVALKAKAQRLEQRWQDLCANYLPLAQKDSIWRYHQTPDPDQPASGWKLHVSATILNAPAILKRVAPLLADANVQFKAARSLAEVSKLNSGLHYSYSQIGKIITVYPRSGGEAVSLARRLHKVTYRYAGPSVPFDFRFRGNIYYRFGAFRPLEIAQDNGARTLAIISPDGDLVPDKRESGKPDWIRDPFEGDKRIKRRVRDNPAVPFRVLGALVQRGKGGVYQAVDLRPMPPRLCLLKEGRKNGEIAWDGRDGAWRIRNEELVLSQLSAAGIRVPEVYSSFEIEGNYYLALKFIEGETLHNLLGRLQRRMTIARVLNYGVQLAKYLSQMHQLGWAWRDCKPTNLLVTRQQTLMPIDFEGACAINKPDPLRWGTPGFVPLDNAKGTGVGDDQYALGAILYLLLTARVFDPTQAVALESLRPHVPSDVSQLIAGLLSTNPDVRPDVLTVYLELQRILSTMRK